jgi:hypothetical protein
MASLVVLAASAASAQSADPASPPPQDEIASSDGFGIGVKGGWVASRQFADGQLYPRRDDVLAAVFVGGNRAGRVGVMAELIYGKKGGLIETVPFEASYVGLPVFLRINIGSRNRSGFSLYGIAGPQVDWLLQHNFGEFDLDEKVTSFDISAVAGGGIDFKRFIVEARYVYGLRTFIRTSDVTDSGELKSQALAVLAGIRFK